MQYIEAVSSVEQRNQLSLFLAGGITNCPDWQADVMADPRLHHKLPVTIYNPRRADFPIGDPAAALEQIAWEHDKLKQADAISFWFPCETICPIVLFELGAHLQGNKKLVVGIHPDYQRRQDVEIQTGLARPYQDVIVGFDAFMNSLIDKIQDMLS